MAELHLARQADNTLAAAKTVVDVLGCLLKLLVLILTEAGHAMVVADNAAHRAAVLETVARFLVAGGGDGHCAPGVAQHALAVAPVG